MFFTDDVLQVRNGRFGIIWLAAMKRDLLKKRQYEKENIEETCHELQRHFKPTLTGGMMKIAGFSLRLSAQLAYGVTVVYSLQVSNLYKDVTLAFQDLNRYRSRLMMLCIDLDSKKQKSADNQISVPENYLQDDPTFGEVHGPPCDEFAPMPQAARSETKQRNVVADISTITLPEEITTRPIDDVLLLDKIHTTSFDKPDPDFINFGASGQDGDLGFMEVYSAVANMETPLTATLPSILKEVPKTPTKEKHKPKRSDFDSPLAVPVVQDDTLGEEGIQQTSVDEKFPSDRENLIAEHDDTRVLSNETSDLVLAPLKDTPGQAKKKRKSQIIDKYIELSSDEMRNQLRSINVTIEDYKAEGHLDEPFQIASAKELFENDSHMFSGSYLNHIDDYSHSKKKGRFERLHKTCLPTRTYLQQIHRIEENLLKSKPRKTFSAHKEAQKDHCKLLPEDEYTEMVDRPKFDDTIATDFTVDGSCEQERNISRISGRLAPDMTTGSHSDILEMEHTKDFILEDEFLRTHDIEHGETEPESKQPKPTSSYIDDMLSSSEDGIMFSSLAPPGVVSKQFAAQCFCDVLMMGKQELITMSQQTPYEDFIIFRF